MKKILVFIDDSGDPGFKGPASSDFFIMAAVVIKDTDEASRINQEIINLRKSFGWNGRHEFKFNKAPMKIKLEFLQKINQYNFEIYAVYINKLNYPSMFQFSDDEKLYNWAVKELLEIIPLHKASVNIDGKYGKQHKKYIKTYIRKNLNINIQRIATFDVHDSDRDNLVQLADMVAGSINRSFQIQKTDSKKYINIISNKIIKLQELDLFNPSRRG